MAGEFARLAADLERRAAMAPALISIAVRKAALDTERDAKALAPVDTGFLRNSITTDVTASGAETSAEVGPTALYGPFQEYGTARMGPQPYMGPSFERNAPLLQQTLLHIVAAGL